MITLNSREMVKDGDGYDNNAKIRARFDREGTVAQRESLSRDKLHDGDTWLDWNGKQKLWFFSEEDNDWVTSDDE